MGKVLVVGSQQLYEDLKIDAQLDTDRIIHVSGGLDTMRQALFKQPSKIVLLEHTTDMHTLALLKLLHSNVATTTIPVLLLSKTIDLDQVIRQGVRVGHTTIVRSWDELVPHFQQMEKLPNATDLLVPALKLSLSFIDGAAAFEGLRNIFANGEMRHYKKGERIFNLGESPEYFYYMYSGQAVTAIELLSSHRLVNGIFATGTLFGTLALIIGEPYSQFCEASQDSICLVAPAADFYNVVNSNNEYTKGMASWMARYTREVMYHAANVAYGNVKQRLANALLRLHRCTHRMDIHISRSDLGSIAGMSKESVVRTLSVFKESGILDVVVNRIHILDVPELVKIGRV
jgi:CRP-like cAMP-binding protein